MPLNRVAIRQLRESAGLSRAYIGAQLGRSEWTVSQWEIGSAVPRLDVMEDLADLLGVRLFDLLIDDHTVERPVGTATTPNTTSLKTSDHRPERSTDVRS